LQELLDCLCTDLETNGAGALCWCGVWHGEDVPWEFCAECDGDRCGMAWLRLVSIFAYSVFPEPVIDITCKRPLGYAIEVGAVRCQPVAEADGTMPSPEALLIATTDVYADALAMHHALLCCPASQVAVESYTPINGGGCGGGYWTAYLTFD